MGVDLRKKGRSLDFANGRWFIVLNERQCFESKRPVSPVIIAVVCYFALIVVSVGCAFIGKS